MASREDIKAAKAAGRAMRKAYPTVLLAHYEPKIRQVIITLNGRAPQLLLNPKTTQGLQKATDAELKKIEITGSGHGLYFPKLDVDVYVPGLLDGLWGSKKFMAAQLGKAGGKAKTRAKANAARKNGKLGGRPRKAQLAKKTG